LRQVLLFFFQFTAGEIKSSKVSGLIHISHGFPVGPVVKNLPAHAGDMGLIPGLGRFHVL
jgi:hypothetical protein